MSESKSVTSIEEQLEKLSCPFTWGLESAARAFQKQHKDDTIEDFEDTSIEPLINLSVNLSSCYKKAVLDNDVNEASKILESTNIKKLQEGIFKFKDIEKSIQHILDASRCYILYKMNKTEQIQKILETVIDISDMNAIELATLNGCRCLVWMQYYDYGITEGIKFSKLAIDGDPTKALWHYSLAKNLRRQRRINTCYCRPSSLEQKHFEKAYELEKAPIYALSLSKMYRETHYGKVLSRKEQTMLDNKVLDICNKVITLTDLSIGLLLNLALEFMRIRTSDQLAMVNKCLNRIETKFPNNSRCLHYRGLYYEKCKQFKLALEYHKKAADLMNFTAEWSYLECGMKSRVVNPIEYLQHMLEKYPSVVKDRQQQIILALAVSYYEECNMEKASEYFLQAIEMNPESSLLNKPYKFVTFKTKRSIYDFLQNEFLPKLKLCKKDSPLQTYLEEKLCLQFKNIKF